MHEHPEKQLEILQTRCKDPELYDEVVQMLDSIQESGSYWPQLVQAQEQLADNLSRDRDEMRRFPEKIESLQSGDEFPIPVQIGEYKIKKRIAQGGMGDVFLAERIDQNFHQNVADRKSVVEVKKVVDKY